MPNKSVPIILYELSTNQKLDMSVFKSWGCVAYVLDSSYPYGKLSAKGNKCIFLRYSKHSKDCVFIGEHDSGGLTM